MVFETILNPIFNPLLKLPSVWAIIIISFLITLLTTLAFKYLTDQKKMKKLRKELKEKQAKIKELSKKQPEKALKMQQEIMTKNMELMKQSFKPTLYTMIPIIIIFGWLNAHMAYQPLIPNQAFTITAIYEEGITGNATINTIPSLMISKEESKTQEIKQGKTTWTLKGNKGKYDIIIETGGKKTSKEIIISDKTGNYTQPKEKYKEGPIKEIIISNKKIKPLEGTPIIGNFGWLGIYIIFSIIWSLILRKILGVA